MRKHLLVSLVLAACGGDDGGSDATFVAWGSSTSSITLRWQPVDGATGYQLERDGQSPIALDASAAGYLDRVAEGAHSYRLTALGVDAPAQEAKATTSEDAAVITGDDPVIGEPVVATIGSAGGMIELPAGLARVRIPAGALPDGATVTLQMIASPAGNGELAIDVASEPAPTMPIDVSFAIDEADIGNLAVAEKQDDGVWTTIDGRVEGDRAVVTLAAPSSSMARAIPSSLRRRLVRLRRFILQPDPARVKLNKQVFIFAKALLSDDTCEENANHGLCFPTNDLNGWLGGEPIIETRFVYNREGSWRLGGPGTLEVHGEDRLVTYKAPSTRPTSDVSITFTHKNGMSVTGTIKILRNEAELKFVYDSLEDGIGNNLLAAVHDEFTVKVVIDDVGHVTAIGPIHNTTSTRSNPRPVDPTTMVTQVTPFELVTVESAQFSNVANFTAFISGQTLYADTVVTFQGGEQVLFPGGAAPTSISLFTMESLPFDTITSQRTFTFPPTNWQMTVTPVED